MKPLSSCCQAPVKEENGFDSWLECTSCRKPCTVKNTQEYIEKKKSEGLYGIDPSLIEPTVNASAVESQEKIRADWLKFISESENVDREAIGWEVANFVIEKLAAVSSSDSILREVLGEIGEDERILEPCPPEMYGKLEDWERCEKCDRERATNFERQRIRELLIKRLEK